ncbi:hypothetical protein SISNIDRAFT_471628 [Sistotremastrum niveocremeum HHB9708]|uniref:Uncharacterized protein n=1 Tax=Sistotremastrum niveocremeum HHB9708 TaxID=1314777 RepID=A0A164ME57_9AGAM|nr:hypothetical protein SISNIDRAFT_471628 [Sistotremastrum niveocremeum HHB9708]
MWGKNEARRQGDGHSAFASFSFPETVFNADLVPKVLRNVAKRCIESIRQTCMLYSPRTEWIFAPQSNENQIWSCIAVSKRKDREGLPKKSQLLHYETQAAKSVDILALRKACSRKPGIPGHRDYRIAGSSEPRNPGIPVRQEFEHTASHPNLRFPYFANLVIRQSAILVIPDPSISTLRYTAYLTHLDNQLQPRRLHDEASCKAIFEHRSTISRYDSISSTRASHPVSVSLISPIQHFANPIFSTSSISPIRYSQHPAFRQSDFPALLQSVNLILYHFDNAGGGFGHGQPWDTPAERRTAAGTRDNVFSAAGHAGGIGRRDKRRLVSFRLQYGPVG